ncbi:inner membrane ABC transporter permease protein YejE [mine drainage metagenome]|uniref:Inner membrane ABC transporter permease protein YejE n=1 Tax=mine drainage metagenome TaxID=410659 RepID=A0A1J5T421_9ZZZZ
MSFRLNPLTRRKLQRFRSIKRGYYSFLVLGALLLAAAFGELLVNSRALIVHYQGHTYFPTYTAFHPGTDFGLSYSYETNYRALQQEFEKQHDGNWVLMPLVPYNPIENDFRQGVYPPTAPSLAERHFLGTDTTGRDVLARLFYGFRTAMIFSLLYMAFVYLLGITIGCAMGYFGGTFDLLTQRLVEIWSNIPFLYIVIIVASIVTPNLGWLLAIVVLFSWTGMTYYMRTATYQEKSRDYVAAAQVMGAGTGRIIFRHILPNTLSTLVTFIPFTLASAITLLTALDFLGFGLPPPTPSWGELLRQGTANLDAPWIVASAFAALVVVLSLVTFIGEAIREAFDPKKFTVYK